MPENETIIDVQSLKDAASREVPRIALPSQTVAVNAIIESFIDAMEEKEIPFERIIERIEGLRHNHASIDQKSEEGLRREYAREAIGTAVCRLWDRTHREGDGLRIAKMIHAKLRSATNGNGKQTNGKAGH